MFIYFFKKNFIFFYIFLLFIRQTVFPWAACLLKKNISDLKKLFSKTLCKTSLKLSSVLCRNFSSYLQTYTIRNWQQLLISTDTNLSLLFRLLLRRFRKNMCCSVIQMCWLRLHLFQYFAIISSRTLALEMICRHCVFVFVNNSVCYDK